MKTSLKSIFTKVATIILALITLGGIFIFSMFGISGVLFSLGSFDNPQLDETSFYIILSIIAVIILGPIALLIAKARGRRWSVTLSAFLLLWPYLVSGLILIYLSITLAEYTGWFDQGSEFSSKKLAYFCRAVSLFLASAYYLYFTKMISPLAYGHAR